MWKIKNLLVASILLSCWHANAARKEQVQRVLELFAADPPIALVQNAALKHFAVRQSDISDFRSAARLQALLPELSGSFVRDDARLTRLQTDQAEFGQAFDPNDPQLTAFTEDASKIYSGSLAWDLGSLVFNESELEAYALVGINEDIMKEVTRLYYTRQHNMVALELSPPEDPRAHAALILRTRELEAMLDAYTGGEWSRMKKGGRAR